MKYDICYIVSDVNKAVAFEWTALELRNKGWSISFIVINPGTSELEHFLRQEGFDVVFFRCTGKKHWPLVFWKLLRWLRHNKPAAVHCHLLNATILGLSAARLAGIKSRLYTRHHSSLHHLYHPKGVYWDRLANRLCTKVVAISGIVKEILVQWEGVKPEKIELIPHGFVLRSFSEVSEARSALISSRYGLAGRKPVIGVVSRFTAWKGVQYIIEAFRAFLRDYPDSLLLLFNATGDFEGQLQSRLLELPADSYRTIRFEPDMPAAYACLDIFVHVPIDEHSEAFGQIYVEALAAGIPSIFTLSGIAPDFICHEANALVVPFRDSDAIFSAMIRLWDNEDLRHRLSANGPASVKEKFDLTVMIRALDNLYQQCLSR